MFLLHIFMPYFISLYILLSIKLFKEAVALSFALTSIGIKELASLTKQPKKN